MSQIVGPQKIPVVSLEEFNISRCFLDVQFHFVEICDSQNEIHKKTR